MQCITLLRASAGARDEIYAYLELRRALKLRVFIGQSSARRDRYIAKNRALDTTRSARSQ